MADSEYKDTLDWITGVLEASPFDLDGIGSGGSLEDRVRNVGAKGYVFLEEPDDWLEMVTQLTGAWILHYHVDVHFQVGGGESSTAELARLFWQDLWTKFQGQSAAISGLSHNDTLVDPVSAKDNLWDEVKTERHQVSRLTVSICKALP